VKKIAIILNGISLRKKFFYNQVLSRLQQEFYVDVFETRTRRDAIGLASKAVDKYLYDVVIAAGGDGTLNQVLNGMLQGRESETKLPLIGIFPIGSGNDFARSVDITAEVNQLIENLKVLKHRNLDVGKIDFRNDAGEKGFSYFINVADAGMGPEVVRMVNKSDRTFGSDVAYYFAILSTFFTYKPMEVKIKTSGWQWKNKLRTVAIGNGKFYGHGICIAPDAKMDDGIFSSFVCGDVSVLEFIRHSGALKKGLKVNHPKVNYDTANQIELTSESPCRVEADGELLGFLPAAINIIPGRIKFLC
jgi:YegS/Rv2252/BmrU family lipid kinase